MSTAPGSRNHTLRLPGLALVLVVTLAAGGCTPGEPVESVSSADLLGTWRGVFDSPGGELPVFLEVSRDASAESGLRAAVVNGRERAALSAVTVDGRNVELAFDFYDSRITTRLDPDRPEMNGSWRKTVPEGASTLPFRARKIDSAPPPRRFEDPRGSPGPSASRDFGGSWSVRFADESGTFAARGEFEQDGERLEGTFLTPTGDYRFLAGNVFGEQLRLSTFDGGHAFLFHASMNENGTLAGNFWSRDTYHATWTAERADDAAPALPDAWSQVGLTNAQGRFAFAFPDLEGRAVSLEDPRYAGKVVLVNIFGSWCPNCNDEAPLLAQWDRRFRDRGLELVGLAYEFTGERERDIRQVRRYAERHGIEFPLLLAGISDKTRAGESLPDLTAVIAYPTSIFIGRDGRVRRIHSGFAGPGTGEHHRELVEEFESLLERLLAEDAARPASGAPESPYR